MRIISFHYISTFYILTVSGSFTLTLTLIAAGKSSYHVSFCYEDARKIIMNVNNTRPVLSDGHLNDTFGLHYLNMHCLITLLSNYTF